MVDWNTIAIRQGENEVQFSEWHNSLVNVTWLIRDAAINTNSFQIGSASDPLRVFDRMLEGLQGKRQTLTNIETHVKNLQHELRLKRMNFAANTTDRKIPVLSAAAQSFFPIMVPPQLLLSQPHQQFCLPQATPYSLAVNLAPPAPARVAPRPKKAIPIVQPGASVVLPSVDNSANDVDSRAGNESGSDVSPYSTSQAPVEDVLPVESVPEPASLEENDVVEENIIYEAHDSFRSPGVSEASETFFSCAMEGEDDVMAVETFNKEIQADLSNDEAEVKEDVTLTASNDEHMVRMHRVDIWLASSVPRHVFFEDMPPESPTLAVGGEAAMETQPEPAPIAEQWEIDRNAFDPFEVEQLQKVRTEPVCAPVKGKSGWGDIEEWLENSGKNHVSSSTGKSSITLSPSASIPTTAPGSPISSMRNLQPQFSEVKSNNVNGHEADAYLIYDASVEVDETRSSVDLKRELSECIYRNGKGKPAIQRLSDYQWEIIGNVDEGRSLLTQGPPRSGKTMAYVIGVLNRLKIDERVCQCIVVAETFHQISKIAALFKELGDSLNARCLVEQEHGKEWINSRFKHDRSTPPHVLVCRPRMVREMLLAFGTSGADTKGVTMVVFDEIEAVTADCGAVFVVMNMPHDQLDALIKAEFSPPELEMLPETYLSEAAEIPFTKPPTF